MDINDARRHKLACTVHNHRTRRYSSVRPTDAANLAARNEHHAIFDFATFAIVNGDITDGGSNAGICLICRRERRRCLCRRLCRDCRHLRQVGHQALIRLLAGIFGGNLPDQLRRAYEARLAAENDAERLAIDAQIEAMKLAQINRLATPDNPGLRLAIGIVALALALHLAAVVTVSTFPGLGLTVHALPPPMNDWQGTILLSLFGLSAITRIFKR